MAAPKTTPVKLNYDFWNPERIKAGTIIDMPIKAAKALIATGKAERADDFPSED